MDFLLFGTFWFWAIIVAEIILLFSFTCFNNTGWSVFSLIVFGCILQFGSKINIFSYVTNNWMQLLIYFVGYFFIGTAWMIARWYLYNKEEYDKILKYVNERWRLPRGLNEQKAARDYISKNRPKASEKKAILLDWMIFWWISILIYFCSDFITKIANIIYNFVASMLENISERIFAKLPKDLQVKDND